MAPKYYIGKPGGMVVEHQTLNREVLGLIPTGSHLLCPCFEQDTLCP